MKLVALFLLSSASADKRISCDPAWLGNYEITNDCKQGKGFDDNQQERKGNWCRRQCKYGNSLPTAYIICRCYRDVSTAGVSTGKSKKTACSYQMRLRLGASGWVPFNHTDVDGNYPLDLWGDQGAHPALCVKPTAQAGTCTDIPPLTDFEIKHNTVQKSINWSCTDGNKPGSICEKTCINNHIEHIGNPRQICMCSINDDCHWERTDEKFDDPVYRNRPKSCIKGCDAHPDALSGGPYLVKCHQDDLTHWSDGTLNRWDPLAVIDVGTFNMRCKETKNGDFKWLPMGRKRGFVNCVAECDPLPHNDFKCSNGRYVGSTCKVKCPKNKIPGHGVGKAYYKTRCVGHGYWNQENLRRCIWKNPKYENFYNYQYN